MARLKCPSCSIRGIRYAKFEALGPIRDWWQCKGCGEQFTARLFRNAPLTTEQRHAAQEHAKREAERQLPWWEKEQAIDPLSAPYTDDLAQAAADFATRDERTSTSRLRQRLNKARFRLAEQMHGGYEIDAQLMISHSIMKCIDNWATESEGGHWTMTMFGGPSYMRSVMDGYLIGRVVFGTSKQAHRCSLSRADLVALASRLIDGDTVTTRNANAVISTPDDLGSGIDIDTHRRLAAKGVALAIAEVALHRSLSCGREVVVGLDHPASL